MAHTPRSWSADLSEMTGRLGFDIIDESGHVIATAYATQVVDPSDKRSWMAEGQPEAADNARLIAAAPGLLDAAGDALTLLRFTADHQDELPRNVIQKLEAAIAKTKGGEAHV